MCKSHPATINPPVEMTYGTFVPEIVVTTETLPPEATLARAILQREHQTNASTSFYRKHKVYICLSTLCCSLIGTIIGATAFLPNLQKISRGEPLTPEETLLMTAGTIIFFISNCGCAFSVSCTCTA